MLEMEDRTDASAVPESCLDDEEEEGYMSLPSGVAEMNLNKEDENVPMYEDMSTIEAREKSFEEDMWQKQRKVKQLVASDNVFAKAGFFYDGVGDEVTCFFCGGSLSKFKTEDQPVREHMKYFPTCGYLIEEYSEAAISTFNEQFQHIERPAILPRDTIKKVEKNPDVLPPPQLVSQREKTQRHEKLLQEAMQTEQVKTVVRMGFTIGTIQTAMKQKIEEDNWYYESAEAILQKLIP